jgi:Lar family restriction alleviation protein
MTRAEKLVEPCPFCASEQVTTAPDHEWGDTTWDAICKACGARVRRDLEEQAIAAWNTRASIPTPEASEQLQERVPPRPNFDEFSQALLIAAGLYSDVELAFWLTAPQPLLDMWTPVQLLARGEAPKLLQVMQQIEDGVYI